MDDNMSAHVATVPTYIVTRLTKTNKLQISYAALGAISELGKHHCVLPVYHASTTKRPSSSVSSQLDKSSLLAKFVLTLMLQRA
eukprot:5848791-Pyramimonas_sp.AAC.1